MITEAAVKCGKHIYTGRRHWIAIHDAIKSGEDPPITSKMQGFVTNKGTFLTRLEARQHALECGQVKVGSGEPLISEELW